MTTATDSVMTRLVKRVFPRMPDFYALLNNQCATVVEGLEALEAFMQRGDAALASRVRDLEHEGDRLKATHIDVLQRSFATPIDREDIYRAIIAIDDVLNYAKTTVREMQVLGLPPDEHTLEIAKLLTEGVHALQRGFATLEKDPAAADVEAEHARKTERQTEKVYRRALAELFDARHYVETLTSDQRDEAQALGVLVAPLEGADSATVATSVAFVLEILKRREVYRHMSNTADRIAHAGDVLHDIVVKAV